MRNKKTFWIFATSGALLFLLAWLSMYFSFSGEGLYKWLCSGALFTIGSGCFYLSLVLAPGTREKLATVVLSTVPAIFLGQSFWYSMVLVWVFSFLLYYIALSRMKKEQEERIKFNMYRTLLRGTPIIGTALSLLIAGGFYFSLISQQRVGKMPTFEIEFSQKIVENSLRIVNFITPTDELTWVLEGVTVDEYLTRSIEAQKDSIQESTTNVQYQVINEGIFGEEAAQLLSASQRQSENDLLIQSRSALEKQLGTELKGDEEVKQVLRDFVNKRLKEVITGGSVPANVVPVSVAFGVFVTVRSIFWLVHLFLNNFVALIFSLLVKFGAISFVEKTIKAQKIGQRREGEEHLT